MGTFTYTLDKVGNRTQANETLVKAGADPTDGLNDLMVSVNTDVANSSITGGVQTALLQKLQNALQQLGKGQTGAASNELQAFINAVQAQQGKKKITTAAANDLIAQAQTIISQLQTSTGAAALTTAAAQMTSATLIYQYDSLYRLIRADYGPGVPGSGGQYFEYRYDPVGNRTRETRCVGVPTCSAVTTTYGYDDANRLIEINGNPTYVWDANGNLLSDAAMTYTYDAANHLKTVTAGATTWTNVYNGLGDRVSQTITYTYDKLYRLTKAQYSDGRSYAYTCDSVGNRLTQSFCDGVGCEPAVTPYTYDAANRLTSVNGVAFTWDNNGNLLNDGTVGISPGKQKHPQPVRVGVLMELHGLEQVPPRRFELRFWP